jgi:ABC-type multidrug transport system fused ATPase/permease subunit
MKIRSDVDDIQITKTEKLLAVVLSAFLLLGAIWTYQKLDDVVRQHVSVPAYASGPAGQRLQQASGRLAQAEQERQQALADLELRREAYRTALEARKPAQQLEVEYNAAQSRLQAAEGEIAAAQEDVSAARPAAEAEQQARSRRIDEALDRQRRDTFVARFGLVAFLVVGAYGLLAWMRRRTSRWFPLAGSAVVAATVFAFVFACDYLTDYLDPFDWGIAAISGLGIAATLVTYWGIQRYLIRRLPQRRVKCRECPFCGYPVGSNIHCEGCGRDVIADCTKCETPRRVGTSYCGTCGATSGASAG